MTTAAQCDASAARRYSWTSFNMVATLTKGASTTTIAYTPEHTRGSLVTDSSTLYYFNNPDANVMSEMMAGPTPGWRTYLMAGGEMVAEFFAQGSTTSTSYFVTDHLSSIAAVSNTNGQTTVTEFDSYDAWGKRRNSSGSDIAGCPLIHPFNSSLTLRGYTGQEMLDSFCLVNLNARIYDPAIGRMLGADPTIPDQNNGQSYNRYAYVVNNPLALTDPTGYAEHDTTGDVHEVRCDAGSGSMCTGSSQNGAPDVNDGNMGDDVPDESGAIPDGTVNDNGNLGGPSGSSEGTSNQGLAVVAGFIGGAYVGADVAAAVETGVFGAGLVSWSGPIGMVAAFGAGFVIYYGFTHGAY